MTSPLRIAMEIGFGSIDPFNRAFKKITGEMYENDIIKYNNNEIGKIMIDKPYSFALVKVVDPDLKEFSNSELVCGNSKIKILKPDWIS